MILSSILLALLVIPQFSGVFWGCGTCCLWNSSIINVIKSAMKYCPEDNCQEQKLYDFMNGFNFTI